MRDDFASSVKDILAKRVSFRCSNPGCRKPTSGPQDDPQKAINIGVAAHITAASLDGPRYDSTLNTDARKDARNGIWLCQSCAKLVDNDESRYRVEILQHWKTLSESAALRALESTPNPGDEELLFLRLESLMGDLLAQMREGFHQLPLCRKFVSTRRSFVFNGGQGVFFYYHEDIPDLDSKLDILENHNLIHAYNRTVPAASYRITEALARYFGV